MMTIRKNEQETAATFGNYGVMIQLDYPTVKSSTDTAVIQRFQAETSAKLAKQLGCA